MKNGEDMQFDFKTGSVQKNNIPKGMTVFNTNELNVKKQPMFFGAPLESKDMIHTNTQYLIN